MSALAERGYSTPEKIGVLGAGLMALGLGSGGALVRLGFALMLVACLLDARRLFAAVRREPLAWTALVYATYLLINYAARGGFSASGAKDELVPSLIHTGLLALMVGWVLKGKASAANTVLVFSGLGLCIAMAKWLTTADLQAALGGERVFMGLGANGTGVYFGTALLGFMVFGLFSIQSMQAGAQRWKRIVFCSVGGLAMGLPFVFNQSRSAWLAFVLVMLCSGLLLVWKRRLLLPQFSRASGSPLLVLLILGIAAALMSKNVIVNRVDQEQAALSQWVAGKTDVPDTSVGYRVRMWEAAYHAVLERPLWGYGPGSSPEIIKAETGLDDFPHFHNLYLQTVVEGGVVGLAGAVLVYVFMLRALYRAWRGGQVSNGMGFFLFSAWLFYFVVSFFQIRHDDIHGMAYLGILMGLTYTPWMHRTSAPLGLDPMRS